MKLLSMNIMIWKSIYYSVTNIILLFFLSILFPNIYSGLSFIQVGVEKHYLHTYVRICTLKKIPSIVSHLFAYMLLIK